MDSTMRTIAHRPGKFATMVALFVAALLSASQTVVPPAVHGSHGGDHFSPGWYGTLEVRYQSNQPFDGAVFEEDYSATYTMRGAEEPILFSMEGESHYFKPIPLGCDEHTDAEFSGGDLSGDFATLLLDPFTATHQFTAISFVNVHYSGTHSAFCLTDPILGDDGSLGLGGVFTDNVVNGVMEGSDQQTTLVGDATFVTTASWRLSTTDEADMEATNLEISTTRAKAGDEVVYTATIQNLGPSIARHVVLRIPEVPSGIDPGDDTLQREFEAIPAGESREVPFFVKAEKLGTFDARLEVFSDNDPNERNNTAILDVNRPPVPEFHQWTAEESVTGNVLDGTISEIHLEAGDYDPDDGPEDLVVRNARDGQYGTVACTPAGSCTWTRTGQLPVGEFDSFQYELFDGTDSAPGSVLIENAACATQTGYLTAFLAGVIEIAELSGHVTYCYNRTASTVEIIDVDGEASTNPVANAALSFFGIEIQPRTSDGQDPVIATAFGTDAYVDGFFEVCVDPIDFLAAFTATSVGVAIGPSLYMRLPSVVREKITVAALVIVFGSRKSWDDVTKWAFEQAWENVLRTLTPDGLVRQCFDSFKAQLHWKVTSSGNTFLDGHLDGDPIFTVGGIVGP